MAKCLEPSTVRKILETKVENKYFQLLEIYISQLTQVTKVGLSIHLSSNKKHFVETRMVGSELNIFSNNLWRIYQYQLAD